MSDDRRNRDARAIARGFSKRQREFDNRVRDRNEESARRQRNGLPDIDPDVGPQNSPAALRTDALRRIRGEPAIGNIISEFLPEARDRSHLNLPDTGSFVNFANRDALCLPTGNTFRTNPEPTTGCGPFATPDALECCAQSDLEFCADVAAIVRGRPYAFMINDGGRIVREIGEWMTTYKVHMIPLAKQVSVDTSLSDGLQILKLAILMKTDVTLNLMVSHRNENLDIGLSDVRGHVHVRASVPGASVSFASVKAIARNFLFFKSLVVHCEMDMGTSDADDVVDMIRIMCISSTFDVSEVEFPLPVQIPVDSLGPLLINHGTTMGTNWVDRPRRHDGPLWRYRYSGRTFSTSVTYDLRDNRINVQARREGGYRY